METISERLAQKGRAYGSLFEGDCSRLLRSVNSYGDITELLSSEEPNSLIFSMGVIVPAVADLLSSEQISQILPQLERHIYNVKMREISYGRSQADEDDAMTVSEAAKDAINSIKGYIN